MFLFLIIYLLFGQGENMLYKYYHISPLACEFCSLGHCSSRHSFRNSSWKINWTLDQSGAVSVDKTTVYLQPPWP